MRELKLLFYLLIFCLTTSCTRLYFQEPMPQSGKVVKELPSTWEGRYLELIHTNESLSGRWLLVQKTDRHRWTIKDTTVIYLDSVTLAAKGSGIIKDAYILDEHIFVKTSTDSFELEIHDTIPDAAFALYMQLDLKNQIMQNTFQEEHNELHFCQIRQFKERYFINILEEKEGWMSMCLSDENQNLTIGNLSWKESDNAILKTIIGEDQLTSIGNNSKVYQVKTSISDEQFFKIFDTPELVHQIHWHKTNKGIPTEYLILGFVFILIIGVLVYASKK